MKKLGFGTMRLPLTDKNVSSSIDIEQTKKMVDIFIERGFTYFDTAWMYCGFHSEEAVKEALVSRYPRDSFTLASKLHADFIKTKEDRDRVFNEQRRKTGVEFFDYYLIHDINVAHYDVYNKLDCFTWIKEKKAAGLARKIGFSFHDSAEFLDKVLTEQPYFDFVQLQINYLDWESDKVQSRLCYEVARKHGMPIVIMEPVKGGTLAGKLPENVKKMFADANPSMSAPSWAIRFAAGLDGVMMVLSGMSNIEQMLDNTSYMQDFKPLSETETALVRQAANTIRSGIAIPCTGCSYCTEGCPKQIAIPKYIALYNTEKRKSDDGTSGLASFNEITKDFGKPSDCIACGQCENICPQHLHIINDLKVIASAFEK